MTSRTISNKTHGILDYVLSALIFASPWLFGFSHEPLNTKIALIMGAAMAVYSFCTDYSTGVLRALPLAGNLFLDLLVGIFLGSAFMHVAMGTRGALPFAILGLMTIANVFYTPRPDDTKTS
jgi:hypothetical protein